MANDIQGNPLVPGSDYLLAGKLLEDRADGMAAVLLADGRVVLVSPAVMGLVSLLLSGGGAPTNAEYLVGAADASLSAERVVTNTSTVEWDLTTPGQAKATLAAAVFAYIDSQDTASLAFVAANFQGLHPSLTSLVGLATGANKLAYFDGFTSWSQTDFTAFARTLLDDADAATARATLDIALSVNGASATAKIDLDDTTPAAPSSQCNIRWQKDASTPTNVSGYLPNFVPTDGDFVDGEPGAMPRPLIADLGKVMRADQGWAQVGSQGIENAAVTNAKLADMPANTLKVRAAGTSGASSDLAIGLSQLVGRGSSGDLIPIALGANLSMSAGGTLSAAGGGGATTYDQGPFTVATDNFRIVGDELAVSGSDEVAIEGTASLLVLG